jgi:hypothetical protein
MRAAPARRTRCRGVATGPAGADRETLPPIASRRVSPAHSFEPQRREPPPDPARSRRHRSAGSHPVRRPVVEHPGQQDPIAAPPVELVHQVGGEQVGGERRGASDRRDRARAPSRGRAARRQRSSSRAARFELAAARALVCRSGCSIQASSVSAAVQDRRHQRRPWRALAGKPHDETFLGKVGLSQPSCGVRLRA